MRERERERDRQADRQIERSIDLFIASLYMDRQINYWSDSLLDCYSIDIKIVTLFENMIKYRSSYFDYFDTNDIKLNERISYLIDRCMSTHMHDYRDDTNQRDKADDF